jgi:hypothetical protein
VFYYLDVHKRGIALICALLGRASPMAAILEESERSSVLIATRVPFTDVNDFNIDLDALVSVAILASTTLTKGGRKGMDDGYAVSSSESSCRLCSALLSRC